jgi:hypothetical protein
MRLLSVEIDHFKNILHTGSVKIQKDVTCIVGKNESGKTAFLQALHRFWPAQPNAGFNAQRQYPAWLEKQHRRERDLEAQSPVRLIFELEPADIALVEEKFGVGSLHSNELQISRTYGNELKWEPLINEPLIVAHIVQDVPLASKVRPPTSQEELENLVQQLRKFVDEDESKTQAVRETAENS